MLFFYIFSLLQLFLPFFFFFSDQLFYFFDHIFNFSRGIEIVEAPFIDKWSQSLE